ncbi:MATH/TRAF domain [Arabidopsis suecica]|uniref:MATH/TRAF domain n=1 Tax=Arabidopsis suecica TaxID=45249 RepID=A0A8T2H4B3_ARASU|nr:MATH/TRAF domain [Arabidopsis suecica]
MMGTELKKSFSWEIDNLSDRNHDMISSEPFSSGGCEWYLIVHPKGHPGYDHHLSLFLSVLNLRSLRLGWHRRVRCFFVILNQSGKELCRTTNDGRCTLFCAEAPQWGLMKMLPLAKLLEDDDNNKLTIQVYLEVVEVVHQGQSTENYILPYNGVQILASQALSWTHILSRHPDFEVDFVPKYEELRSVYLTLFFCLIETLSKSPQSLSAAELTNAQNQLSELTKVGFKLDWLKSKLEEVSLERNKEVTDGCHVLEERVKNVELTLSGLQVKLDKDKIKYAAAAAGVSSFGFIGFVIKRFFLSCFSV